MSYAGTEEQESKPGWLTTEFYITLFTSVFAFGDVVGLWDTLPDQWASVLWAIVGGLYAVSRGIAKNGVAYKTGRRVDRR